MIDKPALFTFLDQSFPGMHANMNHCEAIGFPWASKPFIKEENGEIVSHVGVLEYPTLINGKFRKIAAIHAVCTKESHRGKQIASDLMKKTLAAVTQTHEAVVLYTGIPEFYERLSFKKIQEYRFHLPLAHKRGTRSFHHVVSPKDDNLFKRLYKEAVPLSNRVWVKDDGTIASFNALYATYPTYWSFAYSPSLNVMISWHIEGKTLHLYDVVGSQIPTLEEILEHLPKDIAEIYFYFSPDLLTNKAIPEAYLYDHGHLMVHGNLPEIGPFMIAPLTRC